MTDAPAPPATPRPKSRLLGWRTILTLALFGASVGAAMGVLPIRSLQASEGLSLLIALSCLAAGLTLLWVSLDQKLMVRVLKFEGGASRTETLNLRRAAGALTIGGLLMAAPVFVRVLDLPGRGLAWAAMLALFVWQSWLNLQVWRRGDELQRRIILEGGALSFWVLQGGLFLYAAAEHIGLIRPIGAWALMSVTMASYLCASAWVGVRRTSTFTGDQ